MLMGKQFKKIVVTPAPPVTATFDPITGNRMLPVPGAKGSPTPTVAPAIAPVAPILAAKPTAAGLHLPKLSRAFLFAGRALFIVRNGQGDKFVYRVRGKESEWPKGSGRMSTSYFLSVKADGGRYPYRYIGIVKTNGDVVLSQKSEFRGGSKEYDVAAWAIRVVVAGDKMIPATHEIEHAGKCGRCGRTLTDETSIQRGIGPDCWSQMGN